MPRKRRSAPISLTSFQQIRALAHPLRLRAFEALTEAPRTGKQLAELLGKKPTHLYHHLRVLEQAGLVRPVSTRKNRGTTEKFYQAVSDRVVLDKGLFPEQVAAADGLIGEIFRVTLDELGTARDLAERSASKPSVLVKRLRIRAPSGRIDELTERLEAWLDDFADASDEQGDREYAVTVALYPTKVDDAE